MVQLGGPGAALDEIMRKTRENNPGRFSTAKATLRFFLKERKRMMDDEGQQFDQITAQGLWYLVEPYIPTKANGKFVKRKNFVSYIREICRDELHCRREDLNIVSGGRADLYYDGEWTTISWDKIEDLSQCGTDGILIEKEGMSRIFVDFVDQKGFAVINTRGFFVDYLEDVSTKSIKEKSNLVLLRDLDPSGMLIEAGAKKLGIPCIGVNDEMLQYLGLTRKDVQDKHPPTQGNNHWKKVKKMAETDPDIHKELAFLSKYRIEIDKVHVKVGSRRLFDYVLHKLEQYHRDLNRVAYPDSYAQPHLLGELATQVHRIGKEAGEEESDRIYWEQADFEGLCDDIEMRRLENEERVRIEVESNKDIKQALKEIEPVVKKLKKVKTKEKEE